MSLAGRIAKRCCRRGDFFSLARSLARALSAPRRGVWVEKYPSDPPFNDGLGCEDALADGRELHAPPYVARLFRSRSYFLLPVVVIMVMFFVEGGAFSPLARVLPGLFNSAHPIIRDRESTSSRPRPPPPLFFLAVARHRSSRLGRIAAEHIGSRVVATCCGSSGRRRGGVPAAALAGFSAWPGMCGTRRSGGEPNGWLGWVGWGAPWGPRGTGGVMDNGEES